jgi:3-dehydroquinate dehydratase
MKNIFDDGRTIDESNFLEYDVSKLLSQGQDTHFENGIDNLDDIRQVLVVAKKVGRLESIGNRAYFIDTLRWLKGETMLVNWHNVPQSDISQILPQTTTEAFNLHTQQLLQNLQAEPLYTSIELALKVTPIIKNTPVTKRVEESLGSAKAILDNVTSRHVSEIESRTTRANNDIQNTFNSTQNNAIQAIESAKNNAYTEIDVRVLNAASQLKQAVALKDWGEVYDNDIAELQYKLYGENMTGLLHRNMTTLRHKLKTNRPGYKKKDWIRLFFKGCWLLIKNGWSLIAMVASKPASLAWRRVFSFSVLAVVASVIVVVPLLALLGIVHTKLFDPADPQLWLTKFLLWLPAIAVASVSYSFVTKNYRIYCNMLDQYRHRRAVAKTAQGIILNVGSNPENEAVRNAMTAAAATSLFEHKVTGHLSKKEVESLGLFDLLRTLGK